MAFMVYYWHRVCVALLAALITTIGYGLIVTRPDLSLLEWWVADMILVFLLSYFGWRSVIYVIYGPYSIWRELVLKQSVAARARQENGRE